MILRVQLLFYQGDADCFFIAQPRCNLGLGGSFGIIAAHLARCRWPWIRAERTGPSLMMNTDK
ncbi:hypothetical protein C7N77_11355 [Aeromonas rivipollensis]|nr:hypothetical protein C7N77_11355 [Aeromonas rivipollensis]HCH54078.1 hypothetical protein [Aeromonas sp.]